MRGKALVWMVFIVLMSAFVLGQSVAPIANDGGLIIDIVPIKNAISAGGTALYNVTITNRM